jgi:nucleotide-binding universal stress UspA family protein
MHSGPDGSLACSREHLDMTATAPPPEGRDRLTGGPVMACVGDCSVSRSVARIAEVLARRLGARVLLATVQQPTRGLMRHDESWSTAAASGSRRPATACVTVGEPSERLLALAARERAQLVVVGAPPSAPGETPLLGNVYLALAGAAPCPVVVVPAGVAGIPTDGPVVCGVDDSPSSRAAAELAAHLARRLESHLLLVRDTSASADRLVAVAERERAQILVTASRGRGSSSSVLLGPIASRLALAARRPVVIVPVTPGNPLPITPVRKRLHP